MEENMYDGSSEEGSEDVQINPDLVLFDIPFFHSLAEPLDDMIRV